MGLFADRLLTKRVSRTLLFVTFMVDVSSNVRNIASTSISFDKRVIFYTLLLTWLLPYLAKLGTVEFTLGSSSFLRNVDGSELEP